MSCCVRYFYRAFFLAFLNFGLVWGGCFWVFMGSWLWVFVVQVLRSMDTDLVVCETDPTRKGNTTPRTRKRITTSYRTGIIRLHSPPHENVDPSKPMVLPLVHFIPFVPPVSFPAWPPPPTHPPASPLARLKHTPNSLGKS